MKQKQDFQIVRKLSENFHPTSDRSSQHHQEVACFLNNPFFPPIFTFLAQNTEQLLSYNFLSFSILFLTAGQDDAVSAASVRLVPAAAGGRPPHCVHQVQEAGHRAPGLQRRAGEGPQVSSLPYHTIYTIPYCTNSWQVVAISI